MRSFRNGDVVKSKKSGRHFLVMEDARPGHALYCKQLLGKNPGIYQYVTKKFAELIGTNYRLTKN